MTLTNYKALIESKLEELIPKSEEIPFSSLFASANYSLSPPAKRLRPLLVLAVAASYDTPLEKALVPACAIELVHTYSLIHDDLPCMDDDDLRRGKPSLHRAFPEWQALLTGDYLLTYAFELLSCCPTLTAEQKIALVRSLSLRSGTQGLIGGQMIDLFCACKQIPWELLEKMHVGKTASLIIASLEFGALIAEAPKADIEALCQIGFAIGLAFQIMDDVLDDTGSEIQLGKPTSSDQKKSKATAVSLLGIDGAKKKASLLLESADRHLGALSRPMPLVKPLLHQMVHRST